MKKLLSFIIVVLIAGSGASTYFVLKRNQKPAPKVTTSSTQASAQTANVGPIVTKKACDVLTLDDAQKILGENAKGGELNSSLPQESNDLIRTTCNYNLQGSAPEDTKVVSLLIRSAKTTAGAQNNKQVFNANKPADAQNISGYGDQAYWHPQFGQLNIFKNNNWYIISSGPVKITDRNPDDAKKLADIIIDKL